MILSSDCLRIPSAIFLSFNLLCCSEKNSTSQEQLSENDSRKSLTYEERQGKQLYNKYCAVCHGSEGKGDGFNAFNLEPRPRDFTDLKYMNALSDARLVETIMRGGRGVNHSPLMPTWGGRLNDGDAAYIVSFVRYLGESNE